MSDTQKINRRSILGGSAALATAMATGGMTAAASGLVLGSATPAVAQETAKPAGMMRYQIGDMTCFALNDGVANFPLGEGFVTNAPLADVQAELRRALMAPDTMSIPFTAMAVQTGGRTVVIDTGNGPAAGGTRGTMFANMEAAGLDRSSVDTVIISHFHPDHISGLKDEFGEKAFPNAEVKVPEAEMAFWMDDGEASRAPDAMKARFEAVRSAFEPLGDAVATYAPGAELAPGITARAAYGHTPGHTVFRLSSGSEQMMVLGDTTNHPALFLRNPEWAVRFDMDAQAAAETRVGLLDEVASDDIMIAGYHFPFPATGHVVKDGDGFQLALVAWQPQL
jgi:glyoxylase-like metal-dependent hydrolase (beta-lactamase superfamily II)